MRKFNYLEDYGLISSTVNGYITQMYKEIELLQENESNPIYEKAICLMDEFKKKYPDLLSVYLEIIDDLVKPCNVEYALKYKKYPEDASNLGIELEKDLKKIFFLEEELRMVAVQNWQSRLTRYDDIVNGEDFMIVAHASRNLPGTNDYSNYKSGKYSCQYLSCSLLSSNEFNTFNRTKTIFMVSIDGANYISSSSYDSVTADFSNPSFETLKEIQDAGGSHFIKVGFTNSSDKAVTTISTPDLIERLSIERELQQNGEPFCYDKSLTNEVVLDRTTTKITGALLLSNGCDLLLDEYLTFRHNNISFKCLNKGLYREKKGLSAYTKEEYDEFIRLLDNLGEYISQNNLSSSFLLNYYNDVVLPMKYSDEINSIIRRKLSEYIDVPVSGPNNDNIR